MGCLSNCLWKGTVGCCCAAFVTQYKSPFLVLELGSLSKDQLVVNLFLQFRILTLFHDDQENSVPFFAPEKINDDVLTQDICQSFRNIFKVPKTGDALDDSHSWELLHWILFEFVEDEIGQVPAILFSKIIKEKLNNIIAISILNNSIKMMKKFVHELLFHVVD